MTRKNIVAASDDALDRLTDRTRAKARAGRPLGPAFWRKAKLTEPEPKAAISLRVDQDVLTWFKRQGRGYQTRMNAVLRIYMQAQRRQG